MDRALPAIAERVRATGERLHVVSDDPAVLDRLDALLWSYKAESFLPHGREGDPPILLAPLGTVSGYPNLAFVDGVWRDAPEGTTRIFYFFEAETLHEAREAWRGLADRPVERRYWKQDEDGRWVEGP